ncbi:lactococcin 972 family bacteriocin [Propioniciclava flava]
MWNYGLAGIYASSKYQHPTQAHKSSVRVADRYNSSICFRAGKESDAALTYWAWESRQFYYSASC